ncbi:hypothetical protein ES703_108035 [subsurface metagenome]
MGQHIITVEVSRVYPGEIDHIESQLIAELPDCSNVLTSEGALFHQQGDGLEAADGSHMLLRVLYTETLQGSRCQRHQANSLTGRRLYPAGDAKNPSRSQVPIVLLKSLHCVAIVLRKAIGAGRHHPEAIRQRQLDNVKLFPRAPEVTPDPFGSHLYPWVVKKLTALSEALYSLNHKGVGDYRHHRRALMAQGSQYIQAALRLDNQSLGIGR